jgi:hypothetical protein
MTNLIDWILDLFRDEGRAQAFVADPGQAMVDAGLSNVTSAQLSSVAATAIPSLALGGGDPVAGLQQAVSGYYGFGAQAFAPQPTWSPFTDTGADLLSDNRILSPTTNIQDDHSISFGLGDVTLGDKTTAQGNGAVAVGGSTHGDILSGDGAVLGNGNTVNNGNIHAGAGSNVADGDHNGISAGNTTAGGDVLSTHDGTVIATSGHGTTAAVVCGGCQRNASVPRLSRRASTIIIARPFRHCDGLTSNHSVMQCISRKRTVKLGRARWVLRAMIAQAVVDILLWRRICFQ